VAYARLALAEERATWLPLAVNGLAIPLLLTYFLTRIGDGGSDARVLAASRSGCLCLGGPMAQVGYLWLRDRFMRRAALLGTTSLSFDAYFCVRLSIATFEGLSLTLAVLLVLRAIGLPIAAGAVAVLLLASAAAALALCSWSVCLAQRATSVERGGLMVGLLSSALGVLSPAFLRSPLEAAPPALWSYLSPYTTLASLFEAAARHAPLPWSALEWLLALSVLSALTARWLCTGSLGAPSLQGRRWSRSPQGRRLSVRAEGGHQ